MSDDDVLIEFSMSKFATKQHRLDAMAEQIATLRDALSRLIEVHDAMGGKCGTARIAAEEALAKGEGK